MTPSSPKQADSAASSQGARDLRTDAGSVDGRSALAPDRDLTAPRVLSRRVVAMLACLAGAAMTLPACTDETLLRVGTFDVGLVRGTPDALAEQLSQTWDTQGRALGEILQRTRPDVVVLTSFQADPSGALLKSFQQNFLSMSQNGLDPILYPYSYVAPSNVGVPSGYDLDRDGTVGGPGDALGYGDFPGQSGVAILSRYPILTSQIRTFQTFLWHDMPGAMLPNDIDTTEISDWYTEEELAVVPLASHTLADVPVEAPGGVVHVLATQAVAPTSPGYADSNPLRNHDELRFWADYVSPELDDYIYDDSGTTGGLSAGEAFVIAGGLGADPFDGLSQDFAARQLVFHPQVSQIVAQGTMVPASEGGVELASQEPTLSAQTGDPAWDTAREGLRLDYVLPSTGLQVEDSGLFWPSSTDLLYGLVANDVSSSHRLVWVEVSPGTSGVRDTIAGWLGQ